MSISDQLREAIRAYGSTYAAARDSGVSQSSLCRFMVEGPARRDLYLAVVDRLCKFFGMALTEPAPHKPPVDHRIGPRKGRRPLRQKPRTSIKHVTRKGR